MSRIRRQLLTAWIALVAILFGALAPGLSHAFGRAGAPSLPTQFASAFQAQSSGQVDFPICSAAGHGASVQADEGGADPANASFTHCPYCVDHHHAPGLLPQSGGGMLPLATAGHPPLYYTAPAPLFHWTAPQSRAPPFSS